MPSKGKHGTADQELSSRAREDRNVNHINGSCQNHSAPKQLSEVSGGELDRSRFSWYPSSLSNAPRLSGTELKEAIRNLNMIRLVKVRVNRIVWSKSHVCMLSRGENL